MLQIAINYYNNCEARRSEKLTSVALLPFVRQIQCCFLKVIATVVLLLRKKEQQDSAMIRSLFLMAAPVLFPACLVQKKINARIGKRHLKHLEGTCARKILDSSNWRIGFGDLEQRA